MSQANALERLMLELINEERASAGLQPLRFNGDLNEASEDHSDWMLNRDVFSHTGQNGSSAGDRIQDAGYELEGNWTWGENIAWQSERGAPGLEDDVRDLHESLMNSPGHRANILNADYEEIGIGIEQGDFRSYDSVMVTQNFGTTDATSAPSPAPTPTPAPAPTLPTLPEPVTPTPPLVAEVPDAPSIPTFTPGTPVVPEPQQPPTLFESLFGDTFDFTPAPTPSPTPVFSLSDLLNDLLGLTLPDPTQPGTPQPQTPTVASPPDAPDLPAFATFSLTIGVYDGFDLGA
ncbi:MAG: CAP domain-containing protein [Roseovarius sp.]